MKIKHKLFTLARLVKAISTAFIFDSYVSNILIAVTILGTGYTYYLLNSLESKYYTIYNVLEIKKLNDSINSQFNKTLFGLNYDNINDNIAKINEIVAKIQDDGNLYPFLADAENRNSFFNLKKAINQKTSLIEEYKILKGQISDGIIYLSENLKYVGNIKKIDGIYADLMLESMGLETEFNSIESDISALLEQINDKFSMDYVYLTNANNFAKTMRVFEKKIEENKAIGLNSKISDVIDRLKNFFYSNIRNVFIMFGLFAFIALFAYTKFLVIKAKHKKNLSAIRAYEAIIHHSLNAFLECNKKGFIINSNKTFKRLFGANLIGQKMNFVRYENDKHRKFDVFQDLCEHKKVKIYSELYAKGKNGKLIAVKVVGVPEFTKRGMVDGAYLILTDTTKERQVEHDLGYTKAVIEKSAKIDHVSRLPNYVAVQDMLVNSESSGARLIYVSVNRFNNLHFFYSSLIINLIIVELANSLKLCIDANCPNSTLYKLQDGDFCIKYKGDDIERDAAAICKFFNSKNIVVTTYEDDSIYPDISVTLGVSLEHDTTNIDRLTQSKFSVQKAVKNDKDVEFYAENDEIERIYKQNQEISRLIRYAVKTKDKVIVECQGLFEETIINGEKTYKAASYEILVRIRDEYDNIHYPGEFLGVAKKSSLYIPLTKCIIDLAFDLLDKHQTTRFSLNLSSLDMANESVRTSFLNKLSNCKNASNLTIEILESEEIEDYTQVDMFLGSVKNLGCKIAIDDFGSGYSNYYRLLELNIDYLKIDGSIIRKLPTDKRAKIMVETIISLAEKQGCDIVAEFVADETILEEINKFKDENGKPQIKYLQGFFLGKPTDPAKIKFE